MSKMSPDQNTREYADKRQTMGHRDYNKRTLHERVSKSTKESNRPQERERHAPPCGCKPFGAYSAHIADCIGPLFLEL